MREIQDMTLNVSRGLERLERRLLERSERFQREFSRLTTPEDAFGIRLTAVPTGEEIRLDRVFQQGSIRKEFFVRWFTVSRTSEHAPETLWSPLLNPPSDWRPILRGARAEFDFLRNNLPHVVYRELHSDGLTELGYVRCSSEVRNGKLFSPDWLVVIFANMAIWADHVRKQAGAPTTEYALEAEIRVSGNTVFPFKPPFTPHLTLSNVVFPRYTLNDPDEILQILTSFELDCWNFFHEDISTAQGTLEIQSR